VDTRPCNSGRRIPEDAKLNIDDDDDDDDDDADNSPSFLKSTVLCVIMGSRDFYIDFAEIENSSFCRAQIR